MDTYRIKKAYHWGYDSEIEISSEHLLYIQIGKTHHECRSSNSKNNEEIRDKCKQISDLIRDIEKLK